MASLITLFKNDVLIIYYALFCLHLKLKTKTWNTFIVISIFHKNRFLKNDWREIETTDKKNVRYTELVREMRSDRSDIGKFCIEGVYGEHVGELNDHNSFTTIQTSLEIWEMLAVSSIKMVNIIVFMYSVFSTKIWGRSYKPGGYVLTCFTLML